jgi:hypothetical protein
MEGDMQKSEQTREQVSVIVITHSDHEEELRGMLASLPKGIEICIVNTIESDMDYFQIDDVFEHEGNDYRTGTWYYKNFSFAKARNYSIDLATNDWCVWMDSDDYLLPQFKDDLKDLVNLPLGVGGVMMGCFGSQPPYNKGEKTEYYAVPHLRAFRKSTGARFNGLVHEQILPQIENARFFVTTSNIMIAHMGYIASREKMQARFERNVRLLSAQLATSDYLRDYYAKMLQNQLYTLNDLKGNL